MPQSFKITERDLLEHGFTGRCPGYVQVLRRTTRQAYPEECRQLPEALPAADSDCGVGIREKLDVRNDPHISGQRLETHCTRCTLNDCAQFGFGRTQSDCFLFRRERKHASPPEASNSTTRRCPRRPATGPIGINEHVVRLWQLQQTEHNLNIKCLCQISPQTIQSCLSPSGLRWGRHGPTQFLRRKSYVRAV